MLDSLKEDEEMLHAVLHVDHVRENLAIVLLLNRMVCEQDHRKVLLASVKSYARTYVHVVRVS